VITRRAMVCLSFGALVAPPIAVSAQQSNGPRRIGVLMTAENDPEGQPRAAAFLSGLGVAGWREGTNLEIDWRWTGGDPALFERYAAELASLRPDVLVAAGSLAVKMLQRQTDTIPIVFVHVTDPVDQGFVASLPQPGANITGFSIYDPPMAGKWMELLAQIAPSTTRVGVMFDPATTPYAGLYLGVLQKIAPTLSLAVEATPCRDSAEIEAVIAGLAQRRGALLVLPNTFTLLHRNEIVALVDRHRVPAVYPTRDFPAIGGLMSYGVDLDDLFRRAAGYVDLILKGARPADLPVQNPTKFDLVINLKAAKALGLTLPQSLLARADEVIE
jgi:ABC-type uncharacterized transport system substrate-binding protein